MEFILKKHHGWVIIGSFTVVVSGFTLVKIISDWRNRGKTADSANGRIQGNQVPVDGLVRFNIISAIPHLYIINILSIRSKYTSLSHS